MMNSIKVDHLQRNQEKCESIEEKMSILETSVKTITERKASQIMHDGAKRMETACNVASFGLCLATNDFEINRTVEKVSPLWENKKAKLDQEIYVAKLPINTTCDVIKEYILAQLSREIETEKLKIYRLTKKHQDLSQLTFILFKIETNKEIADQLLGPGFWPDHVNVKSWRRKSVQIPDLKMDQSSNYFLSRAKPDRQNL